MVPCDNLQTAVYPASKYAISKHANLDHVITKSYHVINVMKDQAV